MINSVVYHPSVNKPSSPWEFKEFRFLSDIDKPLQQLKNMGFYLFIVSNQPDISRGNIKEGTTEKINETITQHLPIDEIVTCPHDDHHNCICRKPKPGMIVDLAKRYNIDVAHSYLVGDNLKDIQAGKAAGCTTILLKTGYNTTVDAQYKIESLSELISIVSKK